MDTGDSSSRDSAPVVRYPAAVDPGIVFPMPDGKGFTKQLLAVRDKFYRQPVRTPSTVDLVLQQPGLWVMELDIDAERRGVIEEQKPLRLYFASSVGRVSQACLTINAGSAYNTHVYELLNGERPLNLFFDMDRAADAAVAEDPVACSALCAECTEGMYPFLEWVVQHLTRTYSGVEAGDFEVHLLRGEQPPGTSHVKKWSFHAVIKHPQHMFPNMVVLRQYVLEALATYKGLSPAAAAWAGNVDTRVYSNWRCGCVTLLT